MFFPKPLFTLLLSVLALLGNAQQNPVIPHPQKMEWGSGAFTFNQCTRLQFDRNNQQLQWALAPLVAHFKTAAGLNLNKPVCKNSATINVQLDEQLTQSEGYTLDVQPNKIQIRAKEPQGIFYAVQTLLQLLPVEIESGQLVQNKVWQVPVVRIEDAPRFTYRGAMLDVARHFMPVDSVKRFIDLLAKQKMNRFHWHLTDSQGWRFQSKKYPRLTSVAAYRKGTPLNTTYDYDSRPADTLYGGFYTQDELEEVVQYAAERFITVVPEIEMPAHSRAALAAYPQFACLDSNGNEFAYPQQIQDEYCTREETFNFLTDILSELMDVFPSEYIHIAGDEAAKENWKHCRHDQQRMNDEGLKNVEELQSYFVKRITRFVQSKGRKAIGWDEIMQGGLADGAVVMSWTGMQNGIKAAQQGNEVIMAPGEFCYFDHYQSDAHGEPLAWGGLTTLSKVYGFEPLPALLNEAEAKYIIGAQGNLWTEFIPTATKAEYMMFPRAVALADVLWSQPQHKNYADFIRRLLPYLQRLDNRKVNYARHLFDLKLNSSVDENGNISVALGGAKNGASIFYTLDGSAPNERSPLYKAPIVIKKNSALRAAVILNGVTVAQLQRTIILHKAAGKKAILTTSPAEQYSRGGPDTWQNGILGSDERFNDEEWLGWNEKPFEATVAYDKAVNISTLSTRLFHKPSSWIWTAKKISVQVSDDGVHFRTVAEKEINPPSSEGSVPVQFSWPAVTARYVRFVATPFGAIPAGYIGAGFDAWMFLDEMILQ